MRFIKKFCAGLIVVVFYSNAFTWAQESLTFSFEDRLFLPNEEVLVNFTFDKARASLVKVRPRTDIGWVEIFNQKAGQWVDGRQRWEDMPFLAEKMKVRFLDADNETVKLSFEFQNSKLGTIYLSKEHLIVISSDLDGYHQKLNKNIFLKTRPNENATDETSPSAKNTGAQVANVTYSNKYDNLIKPAFWLFISAVGSVLVLKYSGEKVDSGDSHDDGNISGFGNAG